VLCAQVAMSLPGDRDAQRMLMGEQPLSRGRPLRPPNSSRAFHSGQRLPRRSDSMPQASSASRHLERKADPGIGARSFWCMHSRCHSVLLACGVTVLSNDCCCTFPWPAASDQHGCDAKQEACCRARVSLLRFFSGQLSCSRLSVKSSRPCLALYDASVQP
jgi:hypothetical protein